MLRPLQADGGVMLPLWGGAHPDVSIHVPSVWSLMSRGDVHLWRPGPLLSGWRWGLFLCC